MAEGKSLDVLLHENNEEEISRRMLDLENEKFSPLRLATFTIKRIMQNKDYHFLSLAVDLMNDLRGVAIRVSSPSAHEDLLLYMKKLHCLYSYIVDINIGQSLDSHIHSMFPPKERESKSYQGMRKDLLEHTHASADTLRNLVYNKTEHNTFMKLLNNYFTKLETHFPVV